MTEVLLFLLAIAAGAAVVQTINVRRLHTLVDGYRECANLQRDRADRADGRFYGASELLESVIVSTRPRS